MASMALLLKPSLYATSACSLSIRAALPIPLSRCVVSIRPRSLPQTSWHPSRISPRLLHSSPTRPGDKKSPSQTASELNQQGLDFQEKGVKEKLEEAQENKIKTPWHRAGSDTPPVEQDGSAGAMTKG